MGVCKGHRALTGVDVWRMVCGLPLQPQQSKSRPFMLRRGSRDAQQRDAALECAVHDGTARCASLWLVHKRLNGTHALQPARGRSVKRRQTREKVMPEEEEYTELLSPILLIKVS